jgi:membrane-bound lytic murein transglycosylase D
MHVVENAERYGFEIPAGTARFWQKTKLIRAPKGVPLRTLGQRWELSPTLLAKLNPELRRGRTPAQVRGAYHIRIPATRHTEWMADLESSEDEVNPRLQEIARLKDRVLNPEAYHVPYVVPRRLASVASAKYKVRRGETLSSIARRHRLTVRELISLNRLSVRGRIRAGQTLKVKRAPRATVAMVRVIKAEPLTLKLTKGDTLSDISRWFGVSLSSLQKHNGIRSGRAVPAGKVLKIPHAAKSSYTVRRGEGLQKVARKFGLHQDALMRLNNLKRAQLHAGQRLVVVSRI